MGTTVISLNVVSLGDLTANHAALLTGKLRCYVCLKVPYCSAVHVYNTDRISLNIICTPSTFTLQPVARSMEGDCMCCCVHACNVHCTHILHVVKAADLSTISRLLKITPSISSCPTQGNTTGQCHVWL